MVHVTVNRARKRKQTVYTVVNDKAQFSWTLDKKKRKAKPWVEGPEVFLKCSINTVKAIAEKDFTGGATYFHEDWASPAWAKKMKRTGKYGKLAFYKEQTND